ncbi:multisubstrate pseudouridine synthase 7 [Elasticomyces elasticus]|uniref:Multisubstrate pseudouridine synthase 7 n=1 Tax=Exophiala sideris TaxID=1016849 RepID=A0ABR0JGQ5_9EURO|nr:multisubstrate pseudouridine synthase 7 [Elasticomyces elasticus]KAK5025242.1 multisubstrate pseudouridine synthase 7 [Exophiala sideris]KAK5029210.1 multisubstrate pseudouridine synthase 7 [Exophiala sideris]KAK5063301.1 multisubstrate pseudouridine synthase 7 [Exophiala sideris]KAK5179017.1 multisubstrate pseudouridine synthase 7 [Eurotiomycetes sp. CCFEE 6388]
MEDSASDVRPLKRARLDNDSNGATLEPPSTISAAQHDLGVSTMADNVGTDDGAKELEVGITAFIDASRKPFQGILKKRYTDFLVNEILPDGTVLHLQQMNAKSSSRRGEQNTGQSMSSGGERSVTREEAPAVAEETVQDSNQNEEGTTNRDPSEAQKGSEPADVADEDRAKLVGYFNEEAVNQLIALYESIRRNPKWKPRDHPTVRTAFTTDRSIRPLIHEDIRRIFSRKIESSTDKEGVLVLTAAPPNAPARKWGGKPNDKGQRPGKLGWLDRGGEYVHFTLYKENKDTLEIISALTRQLRTTNRTFQFAGTKDRRAVTTQRVSAYRIEAERLAGLNRTLRFAGIGDFQHQPHGLELGDLKGNEFVITLRDCKLSGSDDVNAATRVSTAQTYLSESLRGLREKGYLNYYGLQRFGTFATRTDVVGLKCLKGDFKGACDDILSFSPVALQQSDSSGTLVGQDDRARAEAIDMWRKNNRMGDALDKIPRKFSAETALIRHLSKRWDDYLGALLSIQRNLRLMYVHAYQSLIWNLAVGERWRLFGDAVVEGDLVLMHEHKDKEAQKEEKEMVDADGEVIINPEGEDRAYDPDDVYERTRALTATEAASGQYSIFDVVLPLPGYDVLYPANASGEWYKTFMATEAGGGLDPYDMRRKQKDFSLSGGYRKVLAKIGEDFDVQVHEYSDDDRQFVETDMDRIKKSKQGEKSGEASLDNAQNGDGVGESGGQQSKLAVVLKFQLGSSQYATMALRELSKGGIQAYKPEFMGGR